MEKIFEIDYQGTSASVTHEDSTQPNQHLFTVQLPDGPLKVKCTKDNEGAYRWLDENDSTSDATKQIGESIETYLMNQHITL